MPRVDFNSFGSHAGDLSGGGGGHTIPAGTQLPGVILVAISFDATRVVTALFGGVPMTRIGASDNGVIHVELWGALNVPTGVNHVTGTLTGGTLIDFVYTFCYTYMGGWGAFGVNSGTGTSEDSGGSLTIRRKNSAYLAALGISHSAPLLAAVPDNILRTSGTVIFTSKSFGIGDNAPGNMAVGSNGNLGGFTSAAPSSAWAWAGVELLSPVGHNPKIIR